MTFDCVGSKKKYRTPAERALLYCLRGFDTKMGGRATRSARGCKHQRAMGVGGGAGEPGGRGRVKGVVRGRSSGGWPYPGACRPPGGRRVPFGQPLADSRLFGLPQADRPPFGPPEADRVLFLQFFNYDIWFSNLFKNMYYF